MSSRAARSARCWAALGAVAALAISGCSTAGSTEAADRGVAPTPETFTADSRVIIPGRPGEEPTVLEPGDTGEVLGAGYSEAEVRFMEQMIPHHSQALAMAALVPDRAVDEQLKIFAERIQISQGPEIEVMETWLQDRGLPVPSEAARNDHAAHAGMPGMLTPLQMQSLAEATGVEFERQFLTYMIAHHQGAIEMAQPVVSAAFDPKAQEMANDVNAKQAVEIGIMQEMLDARS
ncbi:MAG TPA: DUF305 domain-containing protein [Jiangellales bacterium]|nr:DUF305 domain-containing protein [Jiangellales bacterium]